MGFVGWNDKISDTDMNTIKNKKHPWPKLNRAVILRTFYFFKMAENTLDYG